MAIAINTGCKEENIVTTLEAVALRLANTKSEVFMKEDLGQHLNCMAWIAATAMLLKDMLCCIRIVVFLKMKQRIIFVKAMDAQRLPRNF